MPSPTCIPIYSLMREPFSRFYSGTGRGCASNLPYFANISPKSTRREIFPASAASLLPCGRNHQVSSPNSWKRQSKTRLTDCQPLGRPSLYGHGPPCSPLTEELQQYDTAHSGQVQWGSSSKLATRTSTAHEVNLSVTGGSRTHGLPGGLLVLRVWR